ncbi:MAG TPA: hypothetical protein VHX52_04850 [Steroidobacteraceae bacterium]|nr:hypothetical protein [Steroidobacteraceae bacterium]
MEARSALWPQAPHWELIELLHVCDGGARRLEEYRFVPAAGARALPAFHGPGLPVAIMFERSPNGASRARVYSAREWAGARVALLALDPHLRVERSPEDVLARYFPALRSADVDATLALFEPDGYLQRSDGELFQGHARLRARFDESYRNGGIELGCCSRVDDGASTALETCRGGARPAVAVYQRGAGGGRLAAVRLYR